MLVMEYAFPSWKSNKIIEQLQKCLYFSNPSSAVSCHAFGALSLFCSLLSNSPHWAVNYFAGRSLIKCLTSY